MDLSTLKRVFILKTLGCHVIYACNLIVTLALATAPKVLSQ